MSALSEVSCERISALEAGELFAGLVGSKGIVLAGLKFDKRMGTREWMKIGSEVYSSVPILLSIGLGLTDSP
jgi:hypothetical protein